MSVTSPTSASPRTSLLEWDEAAVQSYLLHLGLSQYEDVIIEHGITGDVLAMMDHVSLQELGMTSVGHRLNLLRAVWELKREQGIVMGDDDWRPQDVEGEKKVSPASVDRLWDLILEQQDRLMYLERDHDRLMRSLEENGIQVSDSFEGKQSTRWREFSGRQSDGEDVDVGPSKASHRASQIFPSSLASSTTSTVPAPLSSDSATFQDSFTPTSTSAPYPFDSPSNTTGHGKSTLIQPPPFTRLLSGSSLMPSNSPPARSASTLPSNKGLAPHSRNISSTSPTPSRRSQDDSASVDRDKARDAAKSAANAAKSFRVTLDDPTWKVLPAALKKYKINDDWRTYALFICFGNTERCLSFDEKPLLLFQKLKETGHKPVFMLRHLRDIKSPVAIAQQKQAVKLGLRPNSTATILPQLKPADDTSISPTKANSLQPGRRDNGNVPSDLPSPGINGTSGPNSAGGFSKVVLDKDGASHEVSWAVAIYPYIADRQDEFNVAVGACYVITSKTKGWFIVQRDPNGNGDIMLDQSKSGWVPAGCLLELTAPIAVLNAGKPFDTAYPGLAPLPSFSIVSSSYPGIILMEWVSRGEDQASFKQGERVKVYKRYCNWSYTVNAETGTRGWIPSWFIGKSGSTSSGGESLPSSATTPTGPRPAQTPLTGSTTTTGDKEGQDRKEEMD